MSRSFWLLLALAACGDNSRVQRFIMDAPAGGGDALVDSPMGPQPVTVTVYDGAGLASGIHAYFQNADSSLVDSLVTDATGTASSDLGAGGYVTILAPILNFGGFSYNVVTWAGVKPGDHLIYGSPPSTPINVTFVLPVDATGTVTTYHVSTSCGGDISVSSPQGEVANVPLAGGLSCTGTVDLIAWTADTTGSVLNAFSVTGQTVANNDTIDLTAHTYTVKSGRDYQLNNNPATSTAITGNDFFITSRGTVYTSQNLVFAAGASPATTTDRPAQPANAIDLLALRQNTGFGFRSLVEWGTIHDYTQDWGAHLLPDYTSSPTFDTGTHMVGWTSTGGALTPNVNFVRMQANRQSISTAWSWSMWAPGATAPAFPMLPTDVADLNIGASDNFFATEVDTGNVPGGWDAVRATVFVNAAPIIGATGTASFNVNENIPFRGRIRDLAKHDVMQRWFAPR